MPAEQMEWWDVVSRVGGVAATMVATYVALIVRPISQRLGHVEKELAKHAQVLGDNNTFRAKAEVYLEQNARDHTAIQEKLEGMAKDMRTQADLTRLDELLMALRQERRREHNPE
jgi:type II secretory pathway component PulM